MKKQYLGDSVYVSYDGIMFTLTTENGFGPSNTIHLEVPVYRELIRYAEETLHKQYEDIPDA
jgi:hypothetical protein